MKTADLTGALLNYWVAMAGEEWRHVNTSNTMTLDPSYKGVRLVTYSNGSQAAILQPNNPMRQDPREFSPSTDWAQGGPIIERERIATFSAEISTGTVWGAEMRKRGEFWIDASIYDTDASGPTALIAAMRAFVAGKFGNEVPEHSPAGAA